MSRLLLRSTTCTTPRSPAPSRCLSSMAITSSDHSLKRKQALALARPFDNAGSVTATVDPSFQLDKTIFKTLPPGSLLEKVQKTKLDTILSWDPSASALIESQFNEISPLPASGDEDLHAFMAKHADFSSEHADGSFFEHLHFCRDFTALHYPSGSPKVMLMHSIIGVGTNEFPLDVSEIPNLGKLVTAHELRQIEAFPSILRLLVHGPLLAELEGASASKLKKIKKLTLHRVIDNAPLELGADEVFEALHYHLIHSIDFILGGRGALAGLHAGVR
ncbi:hypothetical protein TeGR_g11674 [Tetraparma gracilis]|uniref:Uncharacterized protein n=1 Tax=Tetraparma gracilis TaxID=2962635 RepID=A0ABQ6MXB8_9STRA|nr:hypothetical protein TeGR_g11674 [Tetraparma gracilis]